MKLGLGIGLTTRGSLTRGAYALSVAVSGTLTDGTDPVTFDPLPYAGLVNGRPSFSDGAYQDIFWDGTEWTMANTEDPESVWESTADVASPELVPSGAWHTTTNPHAWKPVSPATGTPVVTATYQYV